MIPHLRGWSKVFSGDSLTLYPPDGPSVGGIRYRERVRPLARISLIVEHLLARYPLFKDPISSDPETLVTGEGEYAAHVTVRGTIDGKTAQRDVAVVFGDDFYALLSALCTREDRFDEFSRSVRTLVLLDSHALGTRRRRFLYTPPPDWQGLPRGFTTEWSPPEFPRDLTLIHVFPANPVNEPPQGVLDQMLADDAAGGFVLDERIGPEPITSDHALAGLAWQVVGRFGQKPRSLRDLVVFKDSRYLYSLRLETMNEARRAEHRALFMTLVRSAHPIPMPSALEGKMASALASHWTL